MHRSFAVALLCIGCGSAGISRDKVVLAASPPPDDGRSSESNQGGAEHAAALEQLKTAPLSMQSDRQGSLRLPLPDGPSWVRVKFMGIKSLVGFRYGKEHHALVAGFVTYVPDNAVPGACTKSFEQWAAPWIKGFEVEVERETPTATMWRRPTWPGEVDPPAPIPIEMEGVFAKTATLLMKDTFAGAWAAYPAWKGACLILGVAVPSHDEDERARHVRDRFLHEILPKVEVLSAEEPKERY